MEIKVIAGSAVDVAAGAIILDFFEGTESLGGDINAVDKALAGTIARLIRLGDIRGKPGETTLVHTLGRLPAPVKATRSGVTWSRAPPGCRYAPW